MLWLITLALAQQEPPPLYAPTHPDYRTYSNAQFCHDMREATRRTMSELPMMVDTITRMDGMAVNCALRVVGSNRFIMANMSDFREGWRERKQAQFSDLVCHNEEFVVMARRGWRFTEVWTFQSGERFVLDASCPAR
jgi:hypothetical protein